MLLIAMIGLAAALVLVVGVLRAQPATSGISATNTAPQADQSHMSYPATRRAILALTKAKEEIQAADNDFQGHRQETVEAIDRMTASFQYLLQDVPDRH